jgi:hypothetical protein
MTNSPFNRMSLETPNEGGCDEQNCNRALFVGKRDWSRPLAERPLKCMLQNPVVAMLTGLISFSVGSSDGDFSES